MGLDDYISTCYALLYAKLIKYSILQYLLHDLAEFYLQL